MFLFLTTVSIYDYLENRNNQTLFLTPVNEEEVIRALNIWESKTSRDYEDVKKLLTALQNLSLIFVTYLSPLE